MNCKRCNIEMKDGIALQQGYSASEDFPGDATSCGTISADHWLTKLVDCNKCPQCGYSVTKTTEEVTA